MGIRDRISAAARQLLAAGTPDAPPMASAADVIADPTALAQSSRGLLGDLWFSTQAMYNAVTGVGTQRDASFFNAWAVPRPLRRAELFGLGRNGIGYQALAKLPNTAMREGWRVVVTDPDVENTGEVSDKIAAYEKRLALPMHCARAMTRGRQYSEAMVVLGVDDGRSMSEPVDVTRIRSIKWAAVIDVRYYQPAELYQADNENFTRVRTFRITDVNGFLEDGLRYGPNSLSFTSTTLPWEGRATGGELIVHRDRVMHFPTVDYLPLLETLQDSLGAFFETMSGIRTAARESSTVIYKVSDWLRKMWSENAPLAQQHMSLIDRAKSAMNAWVIDQKNEDVQITSRSLGGVADLANPPMVWLSAALAIPVTVLWGVSPGGFGKGEAERQTWHEEVRAYFAWAAEPEINRVAGYILAAQDGCNLPFNTQRVVELNDLSPPDEETRSKLRTEALDDLTKAYAAGGLTRDEYRTALAQLDDDYFRVELTKEGKRVTKDALVGAITGTIEILTAVGQGLIPPESAEIALARLIPSSFDAAAAAELIAPIKARQPAASPASVANAPEAGTTTGAAPGDIEDDETGEEPLSEVALAWSQNPIPPDATEASVIAKELKIPTVRITRAHRAGMIEGWNVLGGKPRYSREEVQRVILQGNGKLPAATDTRDGREPEAYSLAVMLRAPKDVAQWVPYRPEDPSAPHVTLLYGDAEPSRVLTVVDAVRRVLAQTPALRIDVEGLDYFDKPDERIAFARVKLTPELQALYAALADVYSAAGADVQHYLGSFTPHITLAYLAPGEDYTGPVPPHGWTATGVEIWYDSLALPIACAEQPVSDSADELSESTIKRWLVEHISDARKMPRDRMLRLKAVETKYPYLQPPEVTTVYRGLRNVKRSSAGRLVGLSDAVADKSWTTDKRVAAKFASAEWSSEQPDESRVGVVLVADADPSMLLLNHELLAELPGVADWYHDRWQQPLRQAILDEREVLALGQLHVRSVKLVPMSDLPGSGEIALTNDDAALLAAFVALTDVSDAADEHGEYVEESLWLAAHADLSDNAKEKRIAEAFRKYHATVNMGAAELREWAKTEWSRKASVDRSPIERNLRLLETPREDWTLAHAASALRTVNFVSRMRGNERGEPVKIGEREGPSKRDISLKNWAFDPAK